MRAHAEAARPARASSRTPGPVERLPLADDSVGAAWLSTVVHQFPDLAARPGAPPGRRARRPRPHPQRLPRSPGRDRAVPPVPRRMRVAETWPRLGRVITAFEDAGFVFVAIERVREPTFDTYDEMLEHAAGDATQRHRAGRPRRRGLGQGHRRHRAGAGGGRDAVAARAWTCWSSAERRAATRCDERPGHGLGYEHAFLRSRAPDSLGLRGRFARDPGRPRAQPPQRQPRAAARQLIVFTGLSGSGKSSLAFDTIYAEGQRRYVESLSAYARQFLGQMDKPDVDFIEGLSPAISIDQKTASRNPRSTVGTITEVYDYLRLLYARIGVPTAPNAAPRSPARPRSRSSTASSSCPRAPGSRCWRRWCGAARAPTRRCSPTWPRRASPGPGSTASCTRRPTRSTSPATSSTPSRSSSTGSCGATASSAGSPTRWRPRCKLADGVAEVQIVPRAAAPRRRPRREPTRAPRSRARRSRSASTWPAPTGTAVFEELAPRNFSFNSPYGACETCDGLGTRFEVDPELVVPDPDLSIEAGAIAPWAGGHQRYFQRLLEAVADELGHRHGRAVGEAHRQAAPGGAVRQGRRQGAGAVQEPLRPRAHRTTPTTRA